MKQVMLLAVVAVIAIGCNRNRIGDEEGRYEPAASDRSTIETGTSEKDAQTAPPGSATGPAGETSGGAYATGLYQPGTAAGAAPGQGATNTAQPNQ